jgi:hypothetical protein
MHGQGYCLEDDCAELPDSVAKTTCGGTICTSYHENYGYGTLEYDTVNNIFEFRLYRKQPYYNRCFGGWKTSHFKNEIYDGYLSRIKINDTAIVNGL